MEATTLNLSVAKDVNVPVDRLYQAWTNEEDLRQWWRPMNNELRHVDNDIRQGGTVRYVFGQGGNESALEISGTYKDVQEGRHLSYTWEWKFAEDSLQNSNYLLHVTFTPSGPGSRIEVVQENFSDEEAIRPHREGWDKALEDLKQYLEGQS